MSSKINTSINYGAVYSREELIAKIDDIWEYAYGQYVITIHDIEGTKNCLLSATKSYIEISDGYETGGTKSINKLYTTEQILSFAKELEEYIQEVGLEKKEFEVFIHSHWR